MHWQPVKHTVVKNEELAEKLHQEGYAVAGNIGLENIQKLTGLYNRLHQFKSPDGGMFYSLYSQDIGYRREVHSEIGNILSKEYDKHLTGYKSVINSYIVKLSGPQSEFSLHQDSSGLNELRYSPLSLWIPLQDTSLYNGTICVVPHTQGFFYPYRGISFGPPFRDFESLLREYLNPVELSAGDILMFDNRLVHYSPANKSGQARIIVMSGIFPEEAQIEVAYRDESLADAPIEIYKQEEDFLITNTAFYNDCTARPYRGEKIAEVAPVSSKTSGEFLKFVSGKGIPRTNIPELVHPMNSMQIVSEPA